MQRRWLAWAAGLAALVGLLGFAGAMGTSSDALLVGSILLLASAVLLGTFLVMRSPDPAIRLRGVRIGMTFVGAWMAAAGLWLAVETALSGGGYGGGGGIGVFGLGCSVAAFAWAPRARVALALVSCLQLGSTAARLRGDDLTLLLQMLGMAAAGALLVLREEGRLGALFATEDVAATR